MRWPLSTNPLLLGFAAGFVFGVVDLIGTWLYPLADDTPEALLSFYGPMFFVWMFTAFRAAQRTGRPSSAIIAGMAVAFGTFCVFIVLNFVRVNVFLSVLTGRPDWQSMMMRFRASGSESLRLFINLDYIKGKPLKIAVATGIGAVMGTLGGFVGWLRRGRAIRTGLTPSPYPAVARMAWLDAEGDIVFLDLR